MRIREILETTTHRPWELPSGDWKYYQEWNNALFLHWQVTPEELRRFVPPELEIDLYKGNAWVSVVAFTMQKIRPRNLPAFPPVSDFDEINIRTYVKRNNKTGVYFLSIEGGTRVSCLVARKLSELPYRYSEMNRKKGHYSSVNEKSGDTLELDYKINSQVTDKTPLDKWLTERYALFQDTATAINEFEIHHAEWPTYKIDWEKIHIRYPRFSRLLEGTPDRSHYSTGVQVIAWDKTTCKKMVMSMQNNT